VSVLLLKDYPYVAGALAMLNAGMAASSAAIALATDSWWLALFTPFNIVGVAWAISGAYNRGKIAAYRAAREPQEG